MSQLGLNIHTGLVVCTDFVDEMSVFSDCIFIRNEIDFLVSEMETTFVDHFHVVENIHSVSAVTPHGLRYFKPFDVQMF